MALTLEQQRAIAIAEAEAAAKAAAAQPTPAPTPVPASQQALTGMLVAPQKLAGNAVEQKRARRAARIKAEFDAMPGWKRKAITGVDLFSLIATGGSQGLLDKAAAGFRAPFTDKTYAEELRENQRQTEEARARQGDGVGTGAEVLGSIGSGSWLAKKGLTLAGRGGTAAMTGLKGLAARTGLMGVEGAAYGGANAFGEDQDIGTGVGLGLLFGLGGSAAGDLISEGGSRLGKAYTNYVAPAAERVKQQVYEAAESVGLSKVNDLLQRHGPDVMNVDVLGKRGHGMGRNASNYSPEAEELLQSAMESRKAGQNPRVAAKLREAGEIPEATTYETLKADVFNAQKPAINKAYEEAKAAGTDLPYGPFEDILKSPLGEKAYAEAGQSLLNRAAAEGGGVNASANSELARLDLTARKLNDIATEAFRQGKNSLGGEARELEKALKQRIADSIAGPEWRGARDLRRAAGEIDESFDLGANLAKPTIPLDLPGKAATAANPKAVAQAYAAEMQERLLNKGSTEGALNIMSTPMAQQSRQAALGPRASIVDDALATERLFNQSNKALVGNSSTTKQLIGAGLLGAGAGYWQGGFDPFAMGGGAAAMMALKKGGPAALKYVGARRAAAEAPLMAQELLKQGISPFRPIPAGALEKLSTSQREAVKRAIMLGLLQSNQPAER